MSDQELPPARFVFDVAGDTSHKSCGVSKTVKATGARYVIDGPLAQAIKAMLDAHWTAARDAAEQVVKEWYLNGSRGGIGICARILALTPPEDKS